MRPPRTALLLALLILFGGAGLAWPATGAPPSRDRWGISDDSGIRPSRPWGPGAYAKAAEAGFGWTRYWFYWSLLNPAPDNPRTPWADGFDWGATDAVVEGVLRQGFRIYGNIMWAPSWAVQGTKGYEPWQCMNPARPPAFQANPGCDDRRPDRDAFRRFVGEAVRHYRGRIRFWGFWNEPNYPLFWHSAYDPAARNTPCGFTRNLQDFVDFILIPGAEAAREADPDVQIVGPETDNPHALEILLQRDEEYFRKTGRRLFDVISFHQYPKGGAAIGPLLDRFNAPDGPLRFRAGRPVWLTETNAAGNEGMQKLVAAVHERPWIDRAFYHAFKSLKCQEPAGPACGEYGGGPPDPVNLLDLTDAPLPGFYQLKDLLRTSP